MKYADSYMHIKLEVDQEKQAFYVVTKNDGVIIPDEMKEEIFQPLSVLARRKRERLLQVCIGLALSRSLAELHRGTLVMVQGEEANIFRLTLPITRIWS